MKPINSKMDIKAVELYLERSFNKAMKAFSSRGALNTKIRIVEDVIFVKMRTEFTGLEKTMFSYISSKEEDTGYYQSIQEEAKSLAQTIIEEIAPLNVRAINHNFDIDRDFVFTIIILDDDFEKLIRGGEVKRPKQNA